MSHIDILAIDWHFLLAFIICVGVAAGGILAIATPLILMWHDELTSLRMDILAISSADPRPEPSSPGDSRSASPGHPTSA